MIGRFAPSPSGRMHLGNIFCALLAWLSVRSAGGKMLLRIEDLDPQRCKPEYARLLQEDLRWLGLDWDEGGFEDATFCQSSRNQIYQSHYDQLAAQNSIYPCYCTRAERAASAPHRSDGILAYTGHCRNLTHQERSDLSQTRTPCFRVRVPDDASYSFTDGLQGIQTGFLSQNGDFILRRADGVFAYQLAVVVDDALMGVTEVVRGRDLLDSTPQQLFLYRLLGFTPPAFFHVPLLLAPDGRRLSKRDKDTDMASLRKYRPEQLTGYLAFCAGILERYRPLSPKELIPLFDKKKLPKHDIVLDSTVLHTVLSLDYSSDKV